MNLLHNAFKNTPPGGRVALRARAEHGRLLIETEDECGGIPPSKGDLFQKFGDRRGSDRSGLGLGLSIARKACGRTAVRSISAIRPAPVASSSSISRSPRRERRAPGVLARVPHVLERHGCYYSSAESRLQTRPANTMSRICRTMSLCGVSPNRRL